VSKTISVCVAAIALFVHVQPAIADLSEDADRLVLDWSTRGAYTQRIAPVFAEHGQSRIINVAADPARDVIPGCTTVAILGAPTIDYAVAPLRDGIVLELLPLPDGHPAVSLDAASVRSAFGLATLTRCNEERRELNRLVVSMRSPRGTIEAVIARSTASIGDARDVLSERVAGVVAPRGDPGRPIEPGPLAERVVRVEENARLDGAVSVSRVSDVASVQGTGQTRLRLAEGCHRIAVMAAVPSTFPHSATDVDAEARDADGHVLAQDRSETPDAHLEFCIGETARISIMYAGVSGAMPIIVTDAVWPLSASIPNHWGGRVRAGFALALRRRNAPSPTALPVSESLGSSGTTMVPVSIEPDHCYFASVAMLRGEPRSIRISANVGDRYIRDDVNDRPEGAGIAFCSGSEQSARIEVDVRGNNVFWVFALFPFGEATP
jgi:hypothetical protein